MIRSIIILALVVSLSLVALVGCPATPHVYDEATVRHWDEAIVMYDEDIARAAGVDDPAKLTEAHFPLAVAMRDAGTGELLRDEEGKVVVKESLTWEEYQAARTALRVYRDYEFNKRTKDGDKVGEKKED